MKRRDFVLLLAGAMIAARALRAQQQKAMPVIGWLSIGSREFDDPVRLTGFRQGLGDTGYVEGRNVAIEYRWAGRQYDRLPALASDLVRRQVKHDRRCRHCPNIRCQGANLDHSDRLRGRR